MRICITKHLIPIREVILLTLIVNVSDIHLLSCVYVMHGMCSEYFLGLLTENIFSVLISLALLRRRLWCCVFLFNPIHYHRMCNSVYEISLLSIVLLKGAIVRNKMRACWFMLDTNLDIPKIVTLTKRQGGRQYFRHCPITEDSTFSFPFSS